MKYEAFENQSAIQNLLSKVEELKKAINFEFKEESQSTAFSFFASIIPTDKVFNEAKNKTLNHYKLFLKQDHYGDKELPVVFSFIAKYEVTLNQIKELLKRFSKSDDKDFKRLNKFKTQIDALKGDLKSYEESQVAVVNQELAVLFNELAIERENIKQKLIQEVTLGVEKREFASYYHGQSVVLCKGGSSDGRISSMRKKIAIKKEDVRSDYTKLVDYFENEIVDFDKTISERFNFIHDQIIETQKKSIQLDYQFHRIFLENYCQENQVEMNNVLLFRQKMRNLKVLLLQFEKDYMLDQITRVKSEKDQNSLNIDFKNHNAVLPVTKDLSLKNIEDYLEEDFKVYIKEVAVKEFDQLYSEARSYEERHAPLPYFNIFQKKWLSYFQHRVGQLIGESNPVLEDFVSELMLNDKCKRELVN